MPHDSRVAYCFHLEDMVRRRAFASMAVWTAPMSRTIALLASSFGHAFCSKLKELDMGEKIRVCEAKVRRIQERDP